MSVSIVILTATEMEQRPLRDRLGDRHAGRRLVWQVSGVGAGAVAAATLRIVRDLRPAAVVQAGIGGALPHAKLSLAETVLIGSDFQADLGAWRSETGRFEPFVQRPEAETIVCPYAARMRNRFRIHAARSVNTACIPIPRRGDEEVESMEGAAFFGVCRDERVPFLQLRSISNRVGDPRAAWSIPEALQSLADGLARLLEEPDLFACPDLCKPDDPAAR